MNDEMPKVIISLTSYPSRIKTVDQVIRSLLAQTVKPWKIILWLAEEEFPDREKSLPLDLVALTQGTNFEIDWCENIRSYKKLIPTLKKYPDCSIVTVDDDLIYPTDMLLRLQSECSELPHDIHALRVRILTAETGRISTFLDWLPTWNGGQCSAKLSFDNTQIGFGGVLYPAHCLDDRVFNMDLARALCPRQDDLWFWTMAVLRGTRINGVSCKGFNPIPVVGTQQTGLWRENLIDGGNDAAVKRLFDHFPELKAKLSLSHPPLPKNARHAGGLIRSTREGNRTFSMRLNIPLFQMKYNEDFSKITYYILRIPVYRKRFS